MLDIAALMAFIAIGALVSRRIMRHRAQFPWALLAYLAGFVVTIGVGAAIQYLAIVSGDVTFSMLGSALFNLSFWCALVGPAIGLWLAYRARPS